MSQFKVRKEGGGKAFGGNLLCFRTSLLGPALNKAIIVSVNAGHKDIVNYVFKNATRREAALTVQVESDYTPSVCAIGLLGPWIQRDSGSNMEKEIIEFVRFNRS